MSQSIDIYLTYCAMKAHFGKGDYDFVKFNGKTKVSRDSFWKRKDRVWFVMLGRKLNSYLIESVEDYLLANFLVETKGYIGNFNDQNYFDWKDRMARLETLFKNEATKLFEDGTLDVLKVPDNSHLIQSVEDYLLANFIVETKGYIGNFNDQNYFDWMDRMSRLETLFKNEATKLFEDGTLDVLKVPDNSHPKLLKEYLGKRISLETMVILDGIFDYSSKWDKKMSDDVMWPDIKKLIENYKKFLTYQIDSCRMVVTNLTTME